MFVFGQWKGKDVGCFAVLRVSTEHPPTPVYTIHRVTQAQAHFVGRMIGDLFNQGYAVQALSSQCDCNGRMDLDDELFFPIAPIEVLRAHVQSEAAGG